MSPKSSKATVTSLAARQPAPDTLWLTLALQTTLDLEELLTIFRRETTGTVAYDGLRLTSAERGIELRLGRTGRHRCGYHLNLLGESLGEIEFLRNRRFGESELASMEVLLSTLAYPLRNALRYREALCTAQKDPLTGLGNRRGFEEALQREVQLARRNRQPLALLAIDLDHFKSINDTYGHQAGDCVLRSAAESIHQVVRASDLAFRYGGEEFVVILNNTNQEGAEHAAERIRHFIAGAAARCSDLCVEVTASVGVAVLEATDDGTALFGKADRALYQAKAQGRNRAVTFAV